jgi:hypothetical protein
MLTKKDDQKARSETDTEGDADAGETMQKDDPKAEDCVETKKEDSSKWSVNFWLPRFVRWE